MALLAQKSNIYSSLKKHIHIEALLSLSNATKGFLAKIYNLALLRTGLSAENTRERSF